MGTISAQNSEDTGQEQRHMSRVCTAGQTISASARTRPRENTAIRAKNTKLNAPTGFFLIKKIHKMNNPSVNETKN